MNHASQYTASHTPENRFPDLRTGWTVRIHQKIKEKEKAKSQIFEGIIIARKHGNEAGATITVRKISNGIGVEKTVPLRLPSIEKIEVVRKSAPRRARLYYLRAKSAKEIRKKTKHLANANLTVAVPTTEAPVEVATEATS